ncbi:hypothetical protein FHW96_000264 [Novosphingobium sp. SG751A]|uniref:hypothetical protein n=1 Tax=Novosphingobium sp. SG751A TaxID=2587000 RepID=UPI0015576B7F|nr:hypothetical protein [Novosphingobium sp. SG751A]NOW44137.1 hypothetical protein [Novosphingobium sp. SG751A]
MRKIMEPIWAWLLRAAPTYALQYALNGRAGVNARLLLPGEALDLRVEGVCWVTVNED